MLFFHKNYVQEVFGFWNDTWQCALEDNAPSEFSPPQSPDFLVSITELSFSIAHWFHSGFTLYRLSSGFYATTCTVLNSRPIEIEKMYNIPNAPTRILFCKATNNYVE
jgi:hypothetical protein